jgi:acyl-CoA thioester hydrolase
MRALHRTRERADEFPFHVELRVRFAETDAMGVVHHAAYLPYLEVARVEYLRAIGRPYTELRDGDGVELMVVGLQLAYRGPLRFDDVFRVHTGLAHVTRSSFAMEYLLEREGDELLGGFTRHAAIDRASGRPVRIPAWARELAATA